jgi:hypothetical protein
LALATGATSRVILRIMRRRDASKQLTSCRRSCA